LSSSKTEPLAPFMAKMFEMNEGPAALPALPVLEMYAG
jgi:hypothetical protein